MDYRNTWTSNFLQNSKNWHVSLMQFCTQLLKLGSSRKLKKNLNPNDTLGCSFFPWCEVSCSPTLRHSSFRLLIYVARPRELSSRLWMFLKHWPGCCSTKTFSTSIYSSTNMWILQNGHMDYAVILVIFYFKVFSKRRSLCHYQEIPFFSCNLKPQ